MAGKIYVAKVSGMIELDGSPVVVTAGVTRVREGHSLLNGREDMFEEVGVHYEVETARQAPVPESKPKPVKAQSKPEPAKPEAETARKAPEAEARPKPVPQPRGRRKASGLTSDDDPGK